MKGSSTTDMARPTQAKQTATFAPLQLATLWPPSDSSPTQPQTTGEHPHPQRPANARSRKIHRLPQLPSGASKPCFCALCLLLPGSLLSQRQSSSGANTCATPHQKVREEGMDALPLQQLWQQTRRHARLRAQRSPAQLVAAPVGCMHSLGFSPAGAGKPLCVWTHGAGFAEMGQLALAPGGEDVAGGRCACGMPNPPTPSSRLTPLRPPHRAVADLLHAMATIRFTRNLELLA